MAIPNHLWKNMVLQLMIILMNNIILETMLNEIKSDI